MEASKRPTELIVSVYLVSFGFFSFYIGGSKLVRFLAKTGVDNKGQLISKCLFGFFNSSKKQTKDFCLSRLRQKLEFSSSFFGRIEDTKRTFRNKLTFSKFKK